MSDVLRTMNGEFQEFSERYMGHVVARNDDARLKESRPSARPICAAWSTGSGS